MTKTFKGTGVDNQTLSDSQLEHFEASFQGVIACRSFNIGTGYMLFVTPSDEQPPQIPGVSWSELVPADDDPLGTGVVL